jgi:tape measure domain-containing protein
MATERITIIIDERGSRVVRREILDIGHAADRTAGSVNILQQALAALGTAAGAGVLADLTDQYTTLRNKLLAVGVESQRLQATWEALLDVSDRTGFSIQGSVELFTRLANVAQYYGRSQKDLVGLVEAVNNAIYLSGATAEEAQSGIQQLGQSLTSGVAEWEDFETVADTLPDVVRVIADELGVQSSRIKDAVEKGLVTAPVIFRAFEKAAADLQNRAARLAPTISNTFAVLKNQVVDLSGEFNKFSQFSEQVGKAILYVADNLETLAKAAASVAVAFLLWESSNILKSLAKLVASIDPVKALAGGFVLLASSLLVFQQDISLGIDDVTTFGDLLSVTLIPVLGTVRDKVGEAFGLAKDWGKDIDLSLKGVLRFISAFIDRSVALFQGLSVAVVEIFKGIGPAILGSLQNAFSAIRNEIAAFVSTISGGRIQIELDLGPTEAGLGALAGDVGDAFQGELEEGFTGATDYLEQKFLEAQGAAQERLRREAEKTAKQLGVSEARGPEGAIPGAAEEAAKKAKKLAEEEKKRQEAIRALFDQKAASLAALVGRYDAVYAAQQEYYQGVFALSKAETEGFVSAERAMKTREQMAAILQDARDPLGAIVREMDEEAQVMRLGNEERDAEIKLRYLQQNLIQSGILLGDQELTQLRERILLLQEQTRLQSLREAVRGPESDIGRVRGLIESGEVSETEGRDFILRQNQYLLEGTQAGYDSILSEHRAYYEELLTLRENDFISERDVQQAKARLQAEYLDARTQDARSFFSTLASLASSNNQTLSTIGRAARIAEAAISSFIQIQRALSPGGGVQGGLNAAAAGFRFISALGFAQGGSFMVGGGGGTDSQMVAFRATPGERVTVQTPAQQQAASSPVGIRIVNVTDPAVFRDYLYSPDGERVVLNVIQRNGGSIRASM